MVSILGRFFTKIKPKNLIRNLIISVDFINFSFNYKKLKRAVAEQNWKAGGAALGQIRMLIGINLSLGLLTIAVVFVGHALAGGYCYDTMTLIGPGTWDAVEGAAGAALTAADMVAQAAWVDGASGTVREGWAC